MVTLCIVGNNNRLIVEIVQGKASGVFRDESADTQLDLDQVPVGELGARCPGLFDIGRKGEKD